MGICNSNMLSFYSCYSQVSLDELLHGLLRNNKVSIHSFTHTIAWLAASLWV
jgi:hypothetical protein